MRKTAVWLLLLNKRFLKKITYVMILLLIPISIIALNAVSKEESGIVKIALASVDSNDETASKITNELINGSRLIMFSSCESPNKAEEMVKNGSCDGAWIFPDDMQQRIDNFAQNPSEKNYIVKIIERKQSIPLRLTHEKLCGILYKYSSKSVYLNYIRSNIPELSQQTDSNLLEYYKGYVTDFDLFDFAYIDGAEPSEQLQQASYVATPIRGILSIIIVFCGLAASMMFLADEKSGTFAKIKQSNRILVSFAYQFVAMINVAVIALISLFIIGFNVSVIGEILSMLALLICSSVFCTFIQICFPNQNVFGAIMPVFTVIMLIICPVFFSMNSLKAVQMLFPPTYYINSIYSGSYFVFALAYCAILGGLSAIIYKLKKS